MLAITPHTLHLGMMSDDLWVRISYGYFACITLGLLILLEKIFLGGPYVTGFMAIFALTLYLNWKLLA